MFSVDSEWAIQNFAVECVFSCVPIFELIVDKFFFRNLAVTAFVHRIEGGSSVSSVDSQTLVVGAPLIESDDTIAVHVQITEHLRKRVLSILQFVLWVCALSRHHLQKGITELIVAQFHASVCEAKHISKFHEGLG